MKAFFKTSLLLTSLCINPEISQAHYRVGITQIVEHPSLNKIRDGITETLLNNLSGDTEIIYENAQGNPTTATQISQKFAGMQLDLIVPIATPTAQAVANNIKTTPIVFAAISDPIEAKVVESLDSPGGNITGVMDIPPLKEQLEMILQLLPKLKNLGVLYNPGEANSVAMLRELKKLSKQFGISVISSSVTKSGDVSMGSQALIGKVDGILIGTDNTVVSGLEALIKVCNQNRIPLFASDPDSVKRGAYAALAYDQKGIGIKTGEIALRVLNGEKPGQIPIAVPDKMSISFNKKTAKHLDLPDRLEDPL